MKERLVLGTRGGSCGLRNGNVRYGYGKFRGLSTEGHHRARWTRLLRDPIETQITNPLSVEPRGTRQVHDYRRPQDMYAMNASERDEQLWNLI